MKFSDIPWFILERYFDSFSGTSSLAPSAVEYDSTEGNGMLITDKHLISTLGATYMDFYIKKDNLNYNLIKLVINKTWNNIENTIKTVNYPMIKLISTGVIGGFSSHYGFEKTSYLSTIETINYDVSNGDHIYLRKDSLFFDWCSINYPEYLNFFNKNKTFLYLGTCTNINDGIIINYENIHNWVEKSVPETNKTTNFKKFLKIGFDKVYNRIYNSQKDILTITDPLETKLDFLPALSNLFLLELNRENPEILQRQLTKNISNWLKKKGTYSSIFIIWNTVNFNKNKITVYDRWHTPQITGCPYNHFEDHKYIDYYDSSSDYPLEYDLVHKTLSTHFKVLMNISYSPYSDDYIINEPFVNEVLYHYEILRPVNRVDHYTFHIEPYLDLSGNWFELYRTNFLSNWKTKNITVPPSITSGKSINIIRYSSLEWNINHSLDTTHIILEITNEYFNDISPLSVEIIDNNNIKITFVEEEKGYVFITTSNFNQDFTFTLEINNNHSLGEQHVLSQYKKTNNFLFSPAKIENIDLDNSKAYFDTTDISGMSGTSEIIESDIVHHQIYPATSWRVDTMGYKNNLIQFYNDNFERIIPKKVTVISDTMIDAMFGDRITGYAILNVIGNPGLVIENSFYTDYSIQVGTGSYEGFNYKEENRLQESIYTLNNISNTGIVETEDWWYFNFTIPRDVSFTFTELGIFDSYDILTFISLGKPIFKHFDSYLSIRYRLKKVFIQADENILPLDD